MTNRDEIKSIIIKSLETAPEEKIAEAYVSIVRCCDCPLCDNCRKERTYLQTCFEYILEKLEG